MTVRRRGSILMECVLVFPLMFLLISMILQFAHIWTARQITAYAAYCATRAIMTVPPNEQKNAAQKAAEVACSWMALAGTRPNDETWIPGWGSIPGSDSVSKRVSVEIMRGGTGELRNGTGEPFAEVTVHFKFPLVLPLAGRMISLFANNPNPSRISDDTYKVTGWAGEKDGNETVMDEDGNAVTRTGGAWGADGKFPFITLTETCILPMPYSTANFPTGGYRTERMKIGDAL